MLEVDVDEFRIDLVKGDSAWIGLIPFAAWLVKEIQPSSYVELGTHYGHSFLLSARRLRISQ